MKRILVLLLVLLSVLTYAQRSKVTVKNDIYTIDYSEVYLQPLKVNYTVQCTETKFSRAGLDFYLVDTIKTSTPADYFNNEYDKGHMAPAADFACNKEKLAKTFSYANCALQQENLNRGVWRFLEVHERELAKTAPVNVTITVEFKNTSKKLPSGAVVPTGFYKTIEHGEKKEEYYFPNVAPTKKSYTDYLIK